MRKVLDPDSYIIDAFPWVLFILFVTSTLKIVAGCYKITSLLSALPA